MNMYMRKSRLVVVCLYVLLYSSVQSQENKSIVFSALFYNVENLFDTIDNPLKNDNDFLPDSKKKWNTWKYYTKLTDISQVIVAAGQWHSPDIVGLCEVETAACLWDITHKTNLSRLQYSYIHYESPDNRGIDVGLLYNPATFSVLESYPICVSNDSLQLLTRHVLYVKGIMRTVSDTLHVFVCHFPSRMGGEAKSEHKRIHAARVVRKAIDSLYAAHSQVQHVLVMGDFNDSPQNSSISDFLQARAFTSNCPHCLVSVVDTTFPGTHYYKGEWSNLDQTMVSTALFNSYRVKQTIVREAFLTKSKKGSTQIQPYRTYNGQYYAGGNSDHLPVIIQFLEK